MNMASKRASAKLSKLEEYYVKGNASWDIGKSQKSVQDLLKSGRFRSPVLDIGCGTGEHALLLASAGLDVTGVDFSPTAIELAEQKRKRRGAEVGFEQADFLTWLPKPPKRFCTALDVGMFHCLGSTDTARYLKQLGELLEEGGELFLVCLAESLHGEERWPHHYTESELRKIFMTGEFDVKSVEETVDESTFSDDGFRAWLLHARNSGRQSAPQLNAPFG
jgi:cyclopropane fatty-acyl-phospholipid synthase-like methyltransferase